MMMINDYDDDGDDDDDNDDDDDDEYDACDDADLMPHTAMLCW